MSGGVVYVLDRDDFYRRVNKDLVSVEPLEDPEDIQELREMLTQHLEATGSPRAREILEQFEAYVEDFKKLIPWDYAAMTQAIAAGQAQGMEREAAELAAFWTCESEVRNHGKDHRIPGLSPGGLPSAAAPGADRRFCPLSIAPCRRRPGGNKLGGAWTAACLSAKAGVRDQGPGWVVRCTTGSPSGTTCSGGATAATGPVPAAEDQLLSGIHRPGVPCPYEKACVCGTFGQPVTIRDNELAIIEEAFARGTWAPTPRTSGLEKPSRWWAPGRRGWRRPTTSTGGATPSLCWSSPPGRVGCSPMASLP